MIKDFEALREFCAPECDRHAFLTAHLRGKGLPFTELQLTGSRNIFLGFPPEHYDPDGRIKVLTAHYDRAPGSPGANDNSAAVFQLIALAERLIYRSKRHNVLVIFTDHEEIPPENPTVTGQGAYKLGQFLAERARRKTGAAGDFAFFNFDLCGVGDTLILSTANESLLERSGLAGSTLHRQILELQETAMDIMGRVRECPFFSLETPFSDNIGLMLNQFPAVLITMLPYPEAVAYRSRLRVLQQETAALGESGPGFLVDPACPERNRRIRSIVPRTWDRMHTDDDMVETLEENAFWLMEALLDRIAGTELKPTRPGKSVRRS